MNGQNHVNLNIGSQPAPGSVAAGAAEDYAGEARELLGEHPGVQHAGTLALLAVAAELRATREVFADLLEELTGTLTTRGGASVAESVERLADTVEERMPVASARRR